MHAARPCLPRLVATLSLLIVLLPSVRAASVFDWRQHDWERPRPKAIDPGTSSTPDKPGKAPSDAVVLFDGSSLAGWVSLDGGEPKWVIRDGVLECAKGSGYIRTVQAFGDCQLHVEWAAPTPPEGTSQGRGNSGVFLMGLYEVQVLDSHENRTYADGQAAALYGQHPPLVNASRPPGQWQTYDIVFTRPRFDEQGQLLSPARVTVLHNGVLVQHESELVGPTGWLERAPYRAHENKLPLSLQDHGNPVRYRNLWIRELGRDAQDQEITLRTQDLDPLVGRYDAGGGASLTITRPGALLHAAIAYPGKSMSFPLHARSKDAFFIRSFDGQLTFQRRPDGTADEVIFRIGGEDRRGKRQP
ncbi:MAG: DUF1080 domain-containing protein [Verrucomicrobiales bacterium]|nr:DUF1080 domain-containing protein [Verrucomicrobiales bacterium]